MGGFNLLTFFSFLTGASILAQGCGRMFEEREDKEIVEVPSIALDPPVAYELYDSSCQQHTESIVIDRAYIHGWDGLRITDSLQDLADTRTSPVSLESDIVSQTHYDRHFKRHCSGANYLGYQCANANGEVQNYEQKGDENYLRVCRDQFTFPRETYEAVALTSTHYLNEAANFYESVYHKRLPKIRLDILPRFETRVDKFTGGDGVKRDVSSWLTNNLAYFPKNELIAVFPENAEKAKSGSDHFWESAFVLSHELGHHIEKHLVGDEFHKIGLRWDGSEHRFKAVTTTVNDNRAPMLTRMYDSISEGYADLKAFYSRHEDPATVINIPCMGKNRDVSNGLFADGFTPKQLSLSAVRSLLGERKISQLCGEINYTDSHIVGAVIAHGMDQLLNELVATGNVGAASRVQEKYRLIDDWYKALLKAEIAEKSRTLTAERLFQPFAAAIERVALSAAHRRGIPAAQVDALKQRLCVKSRRLFPILDPAPFATADGECSL